MARDAAVVGPGSVVVRATPHSLYLKNGQVFSLQDLTWIGSGDPWIEVLGMKAKIEGSEENRYGDLQGKILVPEIGWLQKSWIERGLAVLAGTGAYPENSRLQLLEAEQKARSSIQGKLQDSIFFEASEPSSFSEKAGFSIVEGRVQNVRTVRGITYLNFGQDWRQDFTAAISPRNRAKFKKQGWKLPDLTSKWVRVRGWVRNYNGPYMDLIFPEQVEMLDKYKE